MITDSPALATIIAEYEGTELEKLAIEYFKRAHYPVKYEDQTDLCKFTWLSFADRNK